MASYADLADATANPVLLKRVGFAVAVAAEGLITDGTDAATRKWLKVALFDPTGESKKALRFILAKNKAATVEQINQSTDEVIQAEVDALVPMLIQAMNNA